MALTEKEIRAIAQTVVNDSKRTSRVDTGALKRSISYTFVRGVVIFRQLFYGEFGNSQLEKNAIKLMPNGTEWKIISTKFGGGTVEVGRTRAGRATRRTSILSALRGGTNKIKALIAASRLRKAKKLKDGET
jgi:hypothetical protein